MDSPKRLAKIAGGPDLAGFAITFVRAKVRTLHHLLTRSVKIPKTEAEVHAPPERPGRHAETTFTEPPIPLR